MTKHNEACPFEFTLSEEEIDAMQWLNRVLRKMVKRDGNNAEVAALANDAIGRLVAFAGDAHDTMHSMAFAAETNLKEIICNPANAEEIKKVFQTAILQAQFEIGKPGEA